MYCIHILCERPTDGRMYSKIVRAIKLALLFSLFLRESKKQIHRQRVYIGTTTKWLEKKRIPGVHNFSSVGRAVDIVVGAVFVVPQCLSNYFPWMNCLIRNRLHAPVLWLCIIRTDEKSIQMGRMIVRKKRRRRAGDIPVSVFQILKTTNETKKKKIEIIAIAKKRTHTAICIHIHKCTEHFYVYQNKWTNERERETKSDKRQKQ